MGKRSTMTHALHVQTCMTLAGLVCLTLSIFTHTQTEMSDRAVPPSTSALSGTRHSVRPSRGAVGSSDPTDAAIQAILQLNAPVVQKMYYNYDPQSDSARSYFLRRTDYASSHWNAILYSGLHPPIGGEEIGPVHSKRVYCLRGAYRRQCVVELPPKDTHYKRYCDSL